MSAWIPQEVFMTLQLSPRSKNTHQRPLTPPPQKRAAFVVASQVDVGATEQVCVKSLGSPPPRIPKFP